MTQMNVNNKIKGTSKTKRNILFFYDFKYKNIKLKIRKFIDLYTYLLIK